jgi:hypothetical protein
VKRLLPARSRRSFAAVCGCGAGISSSREDRHPRFSRRRSVIRSAEEWDVTSRIRRKNCDDQAHIKLGAIRCLILCFTGKVKALSR